MAAIGLLAMIVGLVAFILQIIIVIKIFQNDGALKGILGLICGLYALIWGWQNADRLNIRNVVMGYTGLLILAIILNVVARVMAGNAAPAYP